MAEWRPALADLERRTQRLLTSWACRRHCASDRRAHSADQVRASAAEVHPAQPCAPDLCAHLADQSFRTGQSWAPAVLASVIPSPFAEPFVWDGPCGERSTTPWLEPEVRLRVQPGVFPGFCGFNPAGTNEPRRKLPRGLFIPGLTGYGESQNQGSRSLAWLPWNCLKRPALRERVACFYHNPQRDPMPGTPDVVPPRSRRPVRCWPVPPGALMPLG